MDAVLTMLLTTTLTVDSDYVRDIQKERFSTPLLLLLLKLVPAKTEMNLLLKKSKGFLEYESEDDRKYGREFYETVASDLNYKQRFIHSFKCVYMLKDYPLFKETDFEYLRLEVFSMEYITLSNGVKMPQLGYGVYQVTQDECERCVSDALRVGYRAIDTAQSYFNEEQVGAAIEKSGIDRKDIFLTTKVWVEHYGYEAAKASVLDSMKKLRTDYLDLCLLHQPLSDYYGAWRALEELYEEGKIRAIGVSNFYPDRLVDICSFARIKPMVNQVETHPFNQQVEAKKWMDKYGVRIEAWAPFGEGRGDMFTNPVLAEIGAKYGKTTAQVILRWHLQRGVIVIPKSTHVERMEENLNVFDFTLSDEDMAKIAALDKAQSAFFSHYDPAMVEWFARMVEERKHQHDSSKEKKHW